ncbi:RHS repeat-associated core domain-containing protein [Acinetobacter sp. V110_1]|uniref:RHS repeat-associated core domain-containing protein n=1 Tax=Acinetobacter sp. V110_1 TaxID=3072988 RepID=UPI00287EF449|nr:RHS repeat-associated core domain-containing protein [Acinetobacter sp. V110_1]MDS7944268.1 RHS repeat-associated core domain-containing protein [Acinetobacter sp. V110_1]
MNFKSKLAIYLYVNENKVKKVFFIVILGLIIAESSLAECIQNAGNKQCTPAKPTDWIAKDNKGQQYTFKGNREINTSDVAPLVPLFFPPVIDNNLTIYTKIMENSRFHYKAFWKSWSFLETNSRRTEDFAMFSRDTCYFRKLEGTTSCDSDNAIVNTDEYGVSNEGRSYIAIGFKREWYCPKTLSGINFQKSDNLKLDYFNYARTSISSKSPFIRMCEPPLYLPKKGVSCSVGNPCSVTTGNKFLKENDWDSPQNVLKFERFYNSINSTEVKPGNSPGWNHNFSKKLLFLDIYDNTNVLENGTFESADKDYLQGILLRDDGNEVLISKNYTDSTIAGAGGWFIARDESLKITQQQDGLWRVDQLKTGIKEYYDQTGKFIKMIYPNGQFITLSYADIQLNSTTLLTGMLTQVTNNFGRSLKFNYNPQSLLASVTLPNNKKITFKYDTQNRLISVTRPGYGTKIYHYSESSTAAPSGNPNLLTGITDEADKRYANYAYDSADRGILTEHAGGAQKYTLQHGDKTTSVTDPSGTAWLYNKTLASGTPRISSSIRANVTQAQNSYDQAGNITQKMEKGLTTKYTYDLSRNLETSRTEAVGTVEERKIETTWHTDFPKPTEIKKSAGGQTLITMTFTYDNNGNVLTKTITDPQTQEARTWSYEYNNFDQLIKETSPQGQISSYQYDESNVNLLKTTGADGVITTYSQHNADGQPQHIESSNGQVTDFVYDDAGRIIQQKQTIQQSSLSSNGYSLSWWQVLVNNIYEAFGSDALYTADNQTPEVTESVTTQTATTSYEYDLRGLLIATTLPDGERIEYTYDDAHRLKEIKDQSGNRTVYSLNANGDITQTEVYGTAGQLEAKNQQVYDSLGRLQQSVGNNQQLQTTSYNNYDQVQSDKNALNQSYSYSYDVLGRQISETDPLNGINKTEYDSFDQIKKIIDAKNGITTYQYNAFGEKIAQNSPDTGVTAYQYQNGLLKEKIDALQLKHQYEYDTQGRVTLQKDQKTDGSDSYEQTEFVYGQTGDNQGKLIIAKNKRTETYFSYNNLGLVRQKDIKYLTTNQSAAPQLKLNYSYTLGGKLKQLALPSGNVVNYDYNATGQLTGIRLNDQSFVDNIQYNANGVKGWTYSGVGDSVQYYYDLDGRIKQIQMPNIFDKNYSFDRADRILSINDSYQNLLNNSFKYDALSRLTEQTTADKTLKYTYDKNSNRLSRQVLQGSTSNTENYMIATNSNRLSNIQQGTANKPYTYLATGQITFDGTRSYTYDAQGRSETISDTPNSILNGYDAFGQRIQKFTTIAGATFQTLFVYDENGQLLGEYSPDGKVIREYIWLNWTLVGIRSYQYPNEILRVHTDHLGTPRAISDNQNQVVWRWEGDQFGDVLPQSSVNLVMPMRHAGQYFDSEVGIFYNYFRDYNPITGKYVESDPIGLDGGLNTYGYVGGDALGAVDPKGLATQAEVSKALSLLRKHYPNKFTKNPNSVNFSDINGLGLTNLNNHIVMDSKRFNINGVCYKKDDDIQFLQTLAHEFLHVNENMFRRILSNSFRINNPLGYFHRKLDDEANDMITSDIVREMEEFRESENCNECKNEN